MRIKKIFIIRYGPLQNIELDVGPGLQVVWGRNEAGKTLTIDAVIKMMLEGKVKDFDRINRVEEDPEGFILFEDADGKDKKITMKNGLVRHMKFAGLDLRNIFIIRDSDLTLKQECGYYKNITDKLTGMNLEKIDNLLLGIKDYGRLTRASIDADLSDSREYGKISSLLKTARSFISDSMEYAEQAGEQEYDFLELEQLKLKQEIKDIQDKIKKAEIIQAWDKYEKVSKNLKLISDLLEEYLELKDFNQANYVSLTELDLELDSIGERIIEHKKESDNIGKKKAEIDEEIIAVQASSEPMEDKKREIDKLNNELEIYSRRKSEETREIGSFQKIITVILFILVPASFPIIYFPTKNLLLSFILPGLFIIGSIVMMFFIGGIGKGKNKFKASGKILENSFRKVGLRIKNLDEVTPAVRVFEEKYYKIKQKEEMLLDQKKIIDVQLSENSTKIRNDENKKKTMTIEREKFFNKHNIYSADDFRDKLRIRSRTESNIISGIKNVSDLLGIRGEDDEKWDEIGNIEELAGRIKSSIEDWKREAEKLKPTENIESDKEKNFNPGLYNKLKYELQKSQEKEYTLDQKLDDHRSNLNEFQRRFSQLDIKPYLKDYNAVDINTLEKLTEASGIVKRFTESIERDRSVSIEAIKIFEDIKGQEETKISDLFEKIGISDVFEEITEGKYKGVQFDSNLQSVKVIDEHERELEDSKLSKGAYDQLFLAIRVAIAEEVLGEGKGFFIMDDAFLSSDSHRIKNQFKVLKRLADKGWSILYFSVKDEVKKLALKFSKNKVLEI